MEVADERGIQIVAGRNTGTIYRIVMRKTASFPITIGRICLASDRTGAWALLYSLT